MATAALSCSPIHRDQPANQCIDPRQLIAARQPHRRHSLTSERKTMRQR